MTLYIERYFYSYNIDYYTNKNPTEVILTFTGLKVRQPSQ
jgi:hypothetical protein